MIHSLNVEYRQLNILRMRFLRTLQECKGVIQPAEFETALRSVMKNPSTEFVELFLRTIKADDGTINYYKLCEIINLYQYHLFSVR